MFRKKVIVTAGLLLALMSIGVGAVVWSLVQVPDFYRNALAEPPDAARQREAADTFVARTVQLVDDIQYSDKWSQEFDASQVNAWLAAELPTKYAEVIPPGVRDPRVGFDESHVLVGFHYESDQWTGIVSLRLRPWVPEPNKLAIEVESIKAGLLPIPLESVLEQLSQQIETDGWRAEWSQLDGNDVLIVYFDDGSDDQPVLESVVVAAHSLRISGSGAKRQKPDSSEAGSTFKVSSTGRVSGAGGQSVVR